MATESAEWVSQLDQLQDEIERRIPSTEIFLAWSIQPRYMQKCDFSTFPLGDLLAKDGEPIPLYARSMGYTFWADFKYVLPQIDCAFVAWYYREKTPGNDAWQQSAMRLLDGIRECENLILHCCKSAPKSVLKRIGRSMGLDSWPAALVDFARLRVCPLLECPSGVDWREPDIHLVRLTPDWRSATQYAFDAFRHLAKTDSAQQAPAGQSPSAGKPAGAKAQADVTPKETPKRKTKRGRKRIKGDKESKRLQILEDWERSRGAGVCRKDFCQDKGIGVADLENYQDWQKKRVIRQRRKPK